MRAPGITATHCILDGEASLQEIERHAIALRGTGVDCLVALGGGKCVDAGKAIAHRIGVPTIVVPTLASNDAPCSALSVLYTPAGVYAEVEFYPLNPLFVIVDTEIVAAAPARFLVAGMADAMATWYEARACHANPASLNGAGAGQTIAACAIGEACAHALLSGLGFESGGVAVAHGIARSCTAVPAVHAHYLRGEEVAMGTLAQLLLEGQQEDARRVATFFAAVGLPIHSGQVSLATADHAAIDILVDGTMAWPFAANMPLPVTAPTNDRQSCKSLSMLTTARRAQQ